MQLLLISNSQMPGGGFLAHAVPMVRTVLRGCKRAALIPFASVRSTMNETTSAVRAVFAKMDVAIESVHDGPTPSRMLERADAVVVSGGNTFRLMQLLRDRQLYRPLQTAALDGKPYIGWSAGAVVASRSVMATNSMPVVTLPSLHGLNLVPFHLNVHFTDERIPDHAGESRAQRIQELLILHPLERVVGLREGSMIHVDGGCMRILGARGARLFGIDSITEVADGMELAP